MDGRPQDLKVPFFDGMSKEQLFANYAFPSEILESATWVPSRFHWVIERAILWTWKYFESIITKEDFRSIVMKKLREARILLDRLKDAGWEGCTLNHTEKFFDQNGVLDKEKVKHFINNFDDNKWKRRKLCR